MEANTEGFFGVRLAVGRDALVFLAGEEEELLDTILIFNSMQLVKILALSKSELRLIPLAQSLVPIA